MVLVAMNLAVVSPAFWHRLKVSIAWLMLAPARLTFVEMLWRLFQH